jgi:uncharacterized oxidoreductase
MLSIVIEPAALESPDAFSHEAARFIAHVKDCPTVEPGGEILVPGEPEQRTRAQRLREGIELDDTTWGQIQDVCRGLGVSGE